MSLNLPDRHGLDAANSDSRLTLDASSQGILTDDYGVLLIGCGTPFLTQDFYSQYDGANNARYALFGHRYSTSPGYGLLRFGGYGDNQYSNPERFALRFRPDGGTQATLTVFSATVTLTNCAYVAIERAGDDYAIHLYDKHGTKTAGSFESHDAGSLGMTFRAAASDLSIGGDGYTWPPTQNDNAWRSQLENIVLVQSSSAITSLDDKIKSVILGENAVTEFGASNVLLYRTLKDLTSASLDAHPDATSDAFPIITDDASNQATIGSPLGAVSETVSASIDEYKYEAHGAEAESTTATISITGTYLGAVGNIEGRLLLRSDLSEVQTWTTLEVTPTGNTWSGSFTSVPLGEYCIEVRPSATPANVYEGRNIHAVAPVMLITGQSQDQIAFNALSTGYTLDSVPATAKGYVYSVERHSSNGYRPSVMKCLNDEDYSDGLRYAQIEWEREHPGMPVVWARNCIEGSSIDNWLDNDVYNQGYEYFGDGATADTGLATDVFLTIGVSTANILLSWGTSDITDADYQNKVEGYLFDSGTGYTGASYKHLIDLYPTLNVVLTPLTRAIGVTADNYSADPVSDDYLNSTEFRENQSDIVLGWDGVLVDKAIVGPSVNDMSIIDAGGPHQPTEAQANDEAHYLGGSPRLGARWGIAAASLHGASTVTLPALGVAEFTSEAKTAFSVSVSSGTFGALKNNDVSSDVSGFELSEDNGATWNRKGFSAAYSGQEVTLTKDSGDWIGDTVLWRYHKGGPYSYGSSYTAEQAADIKKALYATGDQEDGLGVPVTQKTNGETGGFMVSDYTPPPDGGSDMVRNVTIKDVVNAAMIREL